MIKGDGCEVNISVECEAVGKSTAVTPKNCRVSVDFAALHTPVCANVDGYCRQKLVSAWYRLMVRHVGDEKTG